MMENKCNKTPNSNNMGSKNGNNKFLDHVYCSSETKNMRNTNNNNNNTSGGGVGGGGVGADLLGLLKENKKLKTMLLLHLDLIQEQSDQLMGKDKQLASLNEEVDMLRTRNVQLETQVDELQKQLQRQIKRSAASAGDLSACLPPPPLAKIQCKADAVPSIAGGKTAMANNGLAASAKPLTTVGSGGGGGGSCTGGGVGGGTVKTVASNQIIGECNGKLISKIILHRVAMPGRRRGDGEIGSDEAMHSPNSTSASDTTSDADDSTQKSRHDLDYEEEELDEEEEEDDDDDDDDDDDEDDDEDDDDDDDVMEDEDLVEEVSSNATDDSNDAFRHEHSKRKRQRKPATASTVAARGAKPRQVLAPIASQPTSTTSTTTATTRTTTIAATTTSVTGGGGSGGNKTLPLQVCITPPTPSRGKQMPLMLWHAPETHETDESASCDSMVETDKLSQPATSPRDAQRHTDGSSSNGAKDLTNAIGTKRTHPTSCLAPTASSSHGAHVHAKARRCAYISTPQLYCTREWEDEEEFICDYEFIKEEANALHADTPNLEIPKWTEHELTVSYSIEGTEDLCDETFLKRHAKFETDEKRRKKWDVQQIREQRRIEKLKRRHCKDELLLAPEPQPLLSFYPLADTIQTICYINDLPVQAFGEIIPKLHATETDFVLSWLCDATTSATTTTTAATANATASSTSAHYKPVVTMANASTLSTQNLSGAPGGGGGGAGGGGGGGGVTGAGAVQVQQQLLNSSFVFLKKRRRQQSSSMTTTARQRSVAAAAAAAKSLTTTHASPGRQ